MERKVIFRDRQELQSDDLNNIQQYMSDTVDRLISDAVADGLYYSGFDTSLPSSGTWEVRLAPGRLYSGGAMYRRGSESTLDLFNYRPVSQKKICAIVVWGQAIETEVQSRDFELATDPPSYQPDAVAMQSLRSAELGVVAGAEAPQPSAPGVSLNNVVIAYATIGTGGIESVTMVADNRLPQVLANLNRIIDLQLWRDDVGTAIDTIRTDQAAMASRFASYALAADVGALIARILAAEGTADRALAIALANAAAGTYLLDNTETFDDARLSDTGASGYAARIEDGVLRFPQAAEDTIAGGLALLSPADPRVNTSGDVTIPAYTHALRLDARGARSGEAAMLAFSTATHTTVATRVPKSGTQYSRESAIYRTYTGIAGATFAANNFQIPQRIKVGSEEYIYKGAWSEVTPGSGVWQVQYLLVIPGETTYETVYREVVSQTNFTGQGRGQVFFNAVGGWLTRLRFDLAEKGATGDMIAHITEVDGDVPNLSRIIASATVTVADLVVGSNQVVLRPTYLEAGKRYAAALLSAGAHKLSLCSDRGQVLLGQHVALSNANRWSKPAGQENMTLSLQIDFARFASSRVEIDLAPLQLAGGIDGILVECRRVLPPGTKLSLEVQVAGEWQSLDGGDGQRPAFDYTTLPVLLPLRAVYIGTPDIMPGFGIGAGNSAVKVRRLGTALKHQAIALDVGSGNTATKARVRVRAENWDAAHTLTLKGLAGSTPVAAASVSDRILPNGILERTATFTFSANRYFTPVIEGTRNTAKPPFRVLDRYDHLAS